MAASPEIEISVGYLLGIVGENSAWSPRVVDVTPPSTTVEVLDSSHQGTVGSRTKIPAALTEPGQLTLEIHFKEDEVPVIGASDPASLDTWTLTYPDGNTWSFPGFVAEFNPATHTLNGIMMSTVVVQVADDLTGY